MARKIIPNPYACSITHAMNIFGSKWKPVIIYLLVPGSMRFGKLTETLPAISKKVLTEQLKELLEDGLILRESFAETPPRVEYRLSEKGAGLLPILRDMNDWVVQHYPKKNFTECWIAPNR